MILFVVLDARGSYTNRIAKAVERNGCKAKIVSWRFFDYRLINELDHENDFVFFRTGAPAAIKIARQFEDAGFNVVNDSRYIELSTQKYLANVYAKTSGIAVPALNVSIPKSNTELLLLHLRQSGPLVAKPILSRDRGRYVFLVRSKRDCARVLSIPGSHILLQSEVRFTRLVRTIVTRNEMMAGATTYDTKRGTWKATVCENPRAKHYRHVPKELIEISEKTIRAFGGHIAYIDYFETLNGFVLNEINHSCGLAEHERISGYPIADQLGKYLTDYRKETLAQRRRLAGFSADLLSETEVNGFVLAKGDARGSLRTS